jgi:hypothetical protein
MFSKKMIASANDVPKNDRLFERSGYESPCERIALRTMFSKKMIASANDVPKNDRLFERSGYESPCERIALRTTPNELSLVL